MHCATRAGTTDASRLALQSSRMARICYKSVMKTYTLDLPSRVCVTFDPFPYHHPHGKNFAKFYAMFGKARTVITEFMYFLSFKYFISQREIKQLSFFKKYERKNLEIFT